MAKYYGINVFLKDGNTSKRVLKLNKQINEERIKEGVLRDIFFKVEDGDREKVNKIEIKEISKEIYDAILEFQEIIPLVLNDKGIIERTK